MKVQRRFLENKICDSYFGVCSACPLFNKGIECRLKDLDSDSLIKILEDRLGFIIKEIEEEVDDLDGKR